MTVPLERKPAFAAVARRGMTATVVAVIINAILFLLGSQFTSSAIALTPLGEPVGIGPVIAFTAMAGIITIIVYFVLSRFLSRVRTRQVMWVTIVVALLAMAYNPLAIESVPAAEINVLQIMYIVAASPAFLLAQS